MISFIIAIAALIAGYFIYGKVVVKNFGVDDRPTPAMTQGDGVDFVPMPAWKAFLIQLLNIAGTGPIFGALAGALFGPIVYLWIVFGCVFAGAVHDYNCGLLSMRHKGGSISEICGYYLGSGMKQFMRVFSVVLLIMCGVVFTVGPADLINMLTGESLGSNIWFVIILGYFFVATFLPIDKVIGKLYPVFGVCLIVMAIGLAGSMMFSGKFQMPELWNNFSNNHPQGLPVLPFMFVSVACGAISGFHATQTPMMARCVKSEREGRRVFYGAMIVEGVIALVWAAAGVTVYENSQALLDAGGGSSAVVYAICQSTMGKVGMILAMVGVIVCPISSGDTAYRAARLTLADWFKLDQGGIRNRLILTIPLLAAGAIISRLEYQVVWRYSAWANQTLAMVALWAISVYLKQNKKNYLITLIPAMFMTVVCISYLMVSPECLGKLWSMAGISEGIYYYVGLAVSLALAGIFLWLFQKKIGYKVAPAGSS